MASKAMVWACGASTRVYNSRLMTDPAVPYRMRRHQCEQGYRFTTFEIAQEHIDRLRCLRQPFKRLNHFRADSWHSNSIKHLGTERLAAPHRFGSQDFCYGAGSRTC